MFFVSELRAGERVRTEKKYVDYWLFSIAADVQIKN